MTSDDWESSSDPASMLRNLRLPVSNRKLQLLVEACLSLCTCGYRRLQQEWPAAQWVAISDVTGCACTRAARAALLRCIVGNPWRSTILCGTFQPHDHNRSTCLRCKELCTPIVLDLARAAYGERQCGECDEGIICHERDSTSDRPCRTCDGTGFVLTPFDATLLPILADALTDAGCTNDAILDHLRSPGPHVKGCWPLDILLGNT